MLQWYLSLIADNIKIQYTKGESALFSMKDAKKTFNMNSKDRAKEKKRYYGDISLSAMIDTKLSSSEFLSMFDDDSLKAKLVLKTPDGSRHKVDVLDIVADWIDWNKL